MPAASLRSSCRAPLGTSATRNSPRRSPGFSRCLRLLSDKGVIVVEVTQALRARDFDELAVTADSWIEAHGHLGGLVIHARRFPGWENLGGLIRHIRFVRDHHRKIRRVAFAADGELAALGPRIGEHFVQAEVKSFAYDALDAAIAWA